MSAQIISKKCMRILPCMANYITDSNKAFCSRSRGSLIDSDSDSLLIATTPGDSDSDSGSDSDSDSAPLVHIYPELKHLKE